MLVNDQQNLELVPAWGFTNGKLNADGRAMAAINALPIEIEGLDVLEGGYRAWKQEHRWLARFASPALDALRQQITILARRLTLEITSTKAATIQASLYEQYVKMAAESREMRTFLLEHYPNHIAQAEAGNRPLAEVMREIMLGKKP